MTKGGSYVIIEGLMKILSPSDSILNTELYIDTIQ